MVITEEMKQLVKDDVLIPNYFSDVIIPDMPWFFNDYIADLNLKPVIKCPLHGENTPSLRYYPETNTYYCWGCGSGGDIIQLHREFMRKLKDEEVSLDEAVKYLYDNFITDSNKGPKKIASKKKAEELNIDKQKLLKYKHTYNDLENKLQKSDYLSLDEKEKLYQAIDNSWRMVEQSLLNPQDAIEYLNKKLEDTMRRHNKKSEEV